MNILLSGKKHFGFLVFNELIKIEGVNVVSVCCPVGGAKEDRLFQIAHQKGVSIIKAGTLNADTMPENIGLIVTAHSHDFIGERTRLKAKYGGIGYHPSMLPLHRGRDAIKWSLRMNERLTGGTVYRLSNKVDGGSILDQKVIFIREGDTAKELWSRELCPLGVKMICSVVKKYAESGYFSGKEQDESLATWEPSIDSAPLYKPDLIMLGHDQDEIVQSNMAIVGAAIDKQSTDKYNG